MTTTHGGARPKVREDDGRTHNRGPGRRPARFTFKVGDKFWIAKHHGDAGTVEGALWTVAAIDRMMLTIHSDNGDVIHIRR